MLSIRPHTGTAGPGPPGIRLVHDEIYKKLFAFPRLVQDLLRGFVAGPWSKAIDLKTLEKLPAEYVSDDLSTRRGDAVWRVRLRGERWLYLLVLLEFQARDEPRMALRILTYTSLLYEELVRNGAVAAHEALPPVLPVVLYNGESAWRAALEVGDLIAPAGPSLAPYQPAQRYCVVDERHLEKDDLPSGNVMTAVVRLEQSRSPAGLERVLEAVALWLRGADYSALRRAFVDWVRLLAERLVPAGSAVPRVATLEELRMSLEERVAEWPKQWMREGMEKGLGQGLEQGIEQQRSLLRRQAALRFGEETAVRLARLLTHLAGAARLAEAGEWIVRCETGADLLARVAALAADSDPTCGGE